MLVQPTPHPSPLPGERELVSARKTLREKLAPSPPGEGAREFVVDCIARCETARERSSKAAIGCNRLQYSIVSD